MSDLEINDHIDQQRWLINNGFFNDMHKDNLYLFGALVHKNVEAVALSIDIATKTVKYQLHWLSMYLNASPQYQRHLLLFCLNGLNHNYIIIAIN